MKTFPHLRMELLSEMIRVLTAVFFFVFATSSVAQDNELTSWEKIQVGTLNKELMRVSTALGLGPLKVSEQVKDAIREFAENDRASGFEDYFFCVPQSIRDSMWEELRETVEKEHLQKLDAHIKLADSFVESSRKDAIKCLVVFLDNHLFLTEEQFAQLETALLPDWPDRQNFPVYLFTFRSLRTTPILESLDRDAINKILTEEQQSIFEQIDKFAVDPHYMLTQAHKAPEFDFTAAQECINLSLSSLAIELRKHGDVSDKQLRFLNVARNGAAKSIRQKWQAATNLSAPENEVLYTTPIVFQMTQQPIMQKTIRRTLGDQFTKYETERLRRQKVRARCLVNYLMFYYFNNSSNIRVAVEQRDAISDSICEKLFELDYVNFQIVNKAVCKDSHEIFEAHLNENDWKTLKSRF